MIKALALVLIGLLPSCLAMAQMTLSGSYELRTDEESREQLGNAICFFPTLTAGIQLPRSANDRRLAWFCFRNTTDAARMLQLSDRHISRDQCGITGRATVQISDYETYRGEGDGYDVATLISVISRSHAQSLRCR